MKCRNDASLRPCQSVRRVKLVAGVGTYIWMLIFGIPYPALLGLLVALLDLVPVVGSTIGGAIVSALG